MKPKKLMSLVGRTSSGIRTAVFNEREHIVVPVIALVEGVIQASNAATPELVLAEEFGRTPQGWNGRPTLENHPMLDGTQVSANDPKVLDRGAFGQVFNARVEDRKLVLEAWLDPVRAARVGELALNVLERVKAGAPVEVSVGVFVATEERIGTHKGVAFSGIWRDIVPDHLALLPEGVTGACSIAMGCGAPRAAQVKEGGVKIKQKFLELLESFRPSQAEDMSDQDLRSALDAALRASTPGFLTIDSVFPEASQVVFAVAPGDTLKLMRQDFILNEDGSIKLKGDPEEVVAVTKFESKAAAEGNPKAAASTCGCGGTKAASTQPAREESPMDVKKKARVAALIASGKTPFKAGDEAALELLSDERLEALEATPVPQAAPAAPTPEPVKLTAEEEEAAFLAKAPESVREVVAEAKAARAAKSNKLITDLKAAQKIYSEDELKTMPLAQLEKLSEVVKASAPAAKRDFSGLGAPRAASAGDDDAPPEPIDLIARVVESRKQAS